MAHQKPTRHHVEIIKPIFNGCRQRRITAYSNQALFYFTEEFPFKKKGWKSDSTEGISVTLHAVEVKKTKQKKTS